MDHDVTACAFAHRSRTRLVITRRVGYAQTEVVPGLRVAPVDPVDAFGRPRITLNLFRAIIGTRTEGYRVSGKFLPVSEQDHETI